MKAKAWNNGAHRDSGAGYGVKIRPEDRDRFFDRNWSEIVVEVPGHGAVAIALSDSFWRNCTELRSAVLGRWLRDTGRAPWPRGEPPGVRLEHLDGNRFTVDAL